MAEANRRAEVAVVFAPPKPWEYEALRADIARRGVVVPIVVDQNGEIIDGHTRAQIAAELGISCPQVVQALGSSEERNLLAIVLNVYRRQLSSTRRTSWLEVANQLRLDLGFEDLAEIPAREPKRSNADDPEAMTARQRHHRLQERVRPKHPLPANADPWEVAEEALELLEAIRRQNMGPAISELFAELEEKIRQLAWVEAE